MENPCKHPTIIMPQDVCFGDLKFIIDFVYKGEIDVSQAQLESLLRTADQLRIKGLCESSEYEEGSLAATVEERKPDSSRQNTATSGQPAAKRFKPTEQSSHQKQKYNQLQPKQEQQYYHRPTSNAHLHPAAATSAQDQQHRDRPGGAASSVGNEQHEQASSPLQRERTTGGGGVGAAAAAAVPRRPDEEVETSAGGGGEDQHDSPFEGELRPPSAAAGSEEDGDDRGRRDRATQREPPPSGGSGKTQRRASRWLHRPPQPVTADERPDQHPPPNANTDQEEEGEGGEEARHHKPVNMTSHGIVTGGQTIFSQFGVDTEDFPPEPPAPSAIPVGHVDMSEHSPTRTLLTTPIHRTDISDSTKYTLEIKKEADIKFETLRSYDQDSLLDMESHMSGPDHSMDSHDDIERGLHQGMLVQHDFGDMMAGVSANRLDANGDEVPGLKNNGHTENMQHVARSHGGGPKTWTQEDMEMALDALRNHNMSLTKASATYGIPSTTLWQRAHRLGIDTPKKEGPTKSWTEENLNSALEALRTGTISANKASKAYGIPSSTLYKIARREGIRLAAPFNAAPTTWTPEDLEKALESIRTGQTSVQKASTEFGIPTGTLYGRCKREGIELSRSNPTPWSEDAMGEALEAVRLGHMSINQAAIHYNLPYSSLYGRFKRGIKYEDSMEISQDSQSQMPDQFGIEYVTTSSHQQIQYGNPGS
ncbi:unnamed protein product [Callosobruchus maculatus]|nr:unnamed protein product [Callosobruchus maculatus]